MLDGSEFLLVLETYLSSMFVKNKEFVWIDSFRLSFHHCFRKPVIVWILLKHCNSEG